MAKIPTTSKTDSLNPVNRRLLTDLVTLQRRQMGKVATLLAGDDLPDYVPAELRSLPKLVGAAFESNIEDLSHRLSGRFEDGEINAPIRESLSELLGVAGGLAEAATDHPMIGLFCALHVSVQEVSTGYLVVHAAGLSAQNSLLAKLSLDHLRHLHSLAERLAAAIPEISVAELSSIESGFSSQVGDPASKHVVEALRSDTQ